MNDVVRYQYVQNDIVGCIRRTSDKIAVDYDEIDKRDPPIFINNTRTKVVVAAGKTATLECRVMNQQSL